MYKQSIIFFGIVIPIIIAGVVIGACVILKGKISASVTNKAQHYSGYEQSRLTALEIEAQISRQRPHLDRWKTLLEEETISSVTTNLRGIAETLPSKEFQQTSFERAGTSTGFGSVSAQSSTGLKFSMRGTFRTVQRALLELETTMPNLQLQELRMDPNTTSQNPMLNFQVSYTAWEDRSPTP